MHAFLIEPAKAEFSEHKKVLVLENMESEVFA